MKSLLREDTASVSTLALNRPDKLNSLTTEMFSLLRQHIENIKNDQNIKCVVIRGAGKCFSAGRDLEDAANEDLNAIGWYSETLRMMETLPQPVIAAVHGHCYTGALELALAADFIIASDTARFGDTHAKWALTPLWGMSQRLPRRVGSAAAKRLMFTSDMIKADEALRIGLVEAVHTQDEFGAAIKTLTDKILSNSIHTHSAYKKLLQATDGMSLDDGLVYEVDRNAGTGPDMMDRINSFMKKS